ncbi:MAG: hypothetical protein ACOCRX_09910 [Candidatus Woesearchaeota archaeon]
MSKWPSYYKELLRMFKGSDSLGRRWILNKFDSLFEQCDRDYEKFLYTADISKDDADILEKFFLTTEL